MAKIGRPRLYETGKQLQKAVDAYFSSITYEREVIVYDEEIVADPRTGEPTVRKTPRKLTDDKGKPVKETAWLEPPSEEALMLFAGIRSRDTWARYAKDDEFGAVIQLAKARIKSWLVSQLNVRNSVQGLIFNLKANYGWTDRVEVTHRGGVEEYLAGLENEGAERGY